MAFKFLIRERGHPFRSFFGVARKQNRSSAMPVDSPITQLSDLKGKVIGLHFPDLLDFAHAAFAGAGLDPKSDVRFLPLPGSSLEEERMVASVRAGEVHVVWQIDLNYGLFGTAGLPLRRLPASVIDRLMPSACLYARDDLLDERTDAFAALGRDRLALSRIEDALDPRWGASASNEVETWQAFMLKTSAIKTRRDPNDYFTAAFVRQYNDFDARALIKQAQTF